MSPNRPIVIGITGAAGSGKTSVLTHIRERMGERARIILADEVAHIIRRRGEAAYEPLVELLGREVLGAYGEIDRGAMAQRIFADKELLEAVNSVIHPAVNAWIHGEIDRERSLGRLDILCIEAALLIENGYSAIVDEMWYIRVSDAVRRRRLKETRGYSDERIDGIAAGQLSDGEFMAHADVVIDNDGTPEETCRQIDRELERLSCIPAGEDPPRA